MKKIILLAATVLLAACSSKPASYLPSGTQPIVNIEAPLNEQLDITASSTSFNACNLSEQMLNVQYKLYWYDQQGVTQSLAPSDHTPWQHFAVAPRAQLEMPLNRPSADAVNYRLYLRGNR